MSRMHDGGGIFEDLDQIVQRVRDCDFVDSQIGRVFDGEPQQEHESERDHRVKVRGKAVQIRLNLIVRHNHLHDGAGGQNGHVGELLHVRFEAQLLFVGRGRPAKHVRAQVQFGEVVVQPDALARVIADRGVVLEPFLPVCAPRIQGDAETPDLRGQLVGQMGFRVQTELVEDPGAGRPDLDLADEAGVVFGGEFRFEKFSWWSDGAKVAGEWWSSVGY